MKSTLKAPSRPPHTTVTTPRPIEVAIDVSAALKCVICQDDMDHRNEQLLALECGHVFHQCCIDQAVRSKPGSNFSSICPHKCWRSREQWARIPIGNDADNGGAASSSSNPVTELMLRDRSAVASRTAAKGKGKGRGMSAKAKAKAAAQVAVPNRVSLAPLFRHSVPAVPTQILSADAVSDNDWLQALNNIEADVSDTIAAASAHVVPLEAVPETLEHDAAVDPSATATSAPDDTTEAAEAAATAAAPDDTTEAAEAAATAPVDVD